MNQEDMQNKIDSILKESKKNNELKQKKERKNKGKSVNKYKVGIQIMNAKKDEESDSSLITFVNSLQN